MKKEEFPTFLNEQPTVVFGRTARELLLIACGSFGGWSVWQDTQTALTGAGGLVLRITLTALPVALGFVVALVSIGYRPLEEWLFTWLLYISTPKLYLYKPQEEDIEQAEDKEKGRRRRADVIKIDDLEED